LLREDSLLVTTNLVVGEAYILIRRAAGHPAAMRFLQALGQTTRLARVYSDASLEEEAEKILHRYADHAFSFTDAVSFVLMQRRGIAEAFAFDKHFAIAGFSLLPPGA
jgi:predicted nucleic acid-binding protein